MRILGVLLVVVGVVMLVVRGINYKTEKEVVDIGPLEVNKTENKRVGWPGYAGALIAVAGIVVLVAARKEKSS